MNCISWLNHVEYPWNLFYVFLKRNHFSVARVHQLSVMVLLVDFHIPFVLSLLRSAEARNTTAKHLFNLLSGSLSSALFNHNILAITPLKFTDWNHRLFNLTVSNLRLCQTPLVLHVPTLLKTSGGIVLLNFSQSFYHIVENVNFSCEVALDVFVVHEAEYVTKLDVAGHFFTLEV